MSNLTPAKPKPARISPALIGAGVLVVALGFGLPKLVPGAAPDPEPAPREPVAARAGPSQMPPPDATGIGASLFKLALGLIVVGGLTVALAKWVGPKAPATAGAMDVLASITVAQCVLHLVRAGDRRLLIGTDLGGVKTILELPGPEPELVTEPGAEASAEHAPPPDETTSLAAPPAPVPTPPEPAEPEPVAVATAVAAAPKREDLLTLVRRMRARATPPA